MGTLADSGCRESAVFPGRNRIDKGRACLIFPSGDRLGNCRCKIGCPAALFLLPKRVRWLLHRPARPAWCPIRMNSDSIPSYGRTRERTEVAGRPIRVRPYGGQS